MHGVDRGAAVSAGPALPAFDPPPIDPHGHRRVHVVMVDRRAPPLRGSTWSGGRAGQLVEQCAQVGAGEEFVAVVAAASHAAIAWSVSQKSSRGDSTWWTIAACSPTRHNARPRTSLGR